MNPKVACALYTRVSSYNQVDKDYNSLETQKERLEAYCKSRGDYEVFRSYEESAKSGDTLNRPALRRMLRDIAEGCINVVLVYKLDRLTRSTKDFHTLLEIFERHGVRFVSTSQSFDTDTATGRLLRNIVLDFAQFEREMTADRTRDKMQQRAAKGLWNGGTVPYGYRNENKRLSVAPDEADRVRFIFRRFAEDPSVGRLRKELHLRGWYTRKGNEWSKMALHNMLRNPTYTGKVRSRKRLFEGQHDAIVEEKLFQRIQTLRPDRTHASSRTHRTYVLRGLVRCADCGSFMSPHYTQKRRKDASVNRIAYYRCTSVMRFDKRRCDVRSVNADQLESTVVDHLGKLSQNDTYVENVVGALNRDLRQSAAPMEKESAQTKQRLAEIDAELSRFVKALGRGTLSIDRLEAEIASRQDDRKALEEQRDITKSCG